MNSLPIAWPHQALKQINSRQLIVPAPVNDSPVHTFVFSQESYLGRSRYTPVTAVPVFVSSSMFTGSSIQGSKLPSLSRIVEIHDINHLRRLGLLVNSTGSNFIDLLGIFRYSGVVRLINNTWPPWEALCWNDMVSHTYIRDEDDRYSRIFAQTEKREKHRWISYAS